MEFQSIISNLISFPNILLFLQLSTISLDICTSNSRWLLGVLTSIPWNIDLLVLPFSQSCFCFAYNIAVPQVNPRSELVCFPTKASSIEIYQILFPICSSVLASCPWRAFSHAIWLRDSIHSYVLQPSTSFLHPMSTSTLTITICFNGDLIIAVQCLQHLSMRSTHSHLHSTLLTSSFLPKTSVAT